MLEMHLARQQLNQNGFSEPHQKIELIEKAQQLYQRAAWKGQAGLVWGKLSGRSRALLSFKTALADQRLAGRHSGGTQVVRVEQICGSVDRTHDFDQNFNPVQAHTEQRWINLAVAWLAGVTLPPVTLIQVGERYFVEDGHHRLSVARALGQSFIDAEVTVWEVWPERQADRAVCWCGTTS